MISDITNNFALENIVVFLDILIFLQKTWVIFLDYSVFYIIWYFYNTFFLK